MLAKRAAISFEGEWRMRLERIVRNEYEHSWLCIFWKAYISHVTSAMPIN